ncbi:GDA1/CD39 nucleoside phosphatase family protein [Actinidia rufa]|uniref:GDA1/CD39 nucleoside phosphatase family protein n=1 Tax=Actinidia rufa TaxID=165716 RepID=A0A7J0EAQ2_9ERIC|nr:GDA1/CD39 nucleoside phosphatase family protein [Actinidia rufa]
MVFSRIVKIVSAAATRFSAPKSSALPYVSSGLSPPANYVHDYGFANSKLKNNLRLSSSLQDLSVYRHLDPEGGDFDSGSDASLIHAKKQHHVLQRGNGGSSFSKEKASPRSPRVQKKWATINHKKDGSLPFLLRSLPEGFQRKPSLQSGRAYNRMETEPGLSIGPVSHHLSAYSLSGYGLNDAFDKSVVHLLKRFLKITNADLASGNIEIKHPCLQSGYKEDYFCSQCASIYKGVGSPLSGGIGLGKGGKPGVPIHLIGAPKWEECRELAKAAVNLSEWSDQNPGIDCGLKPCALADNLPRPYGQFYAMSGFFVVYRFFNVSSDSTLDDVLEKGREFCEKTWDTAKNSVAPQPFIEQYCFRAPYIVFLLREGLHITERQVIIGSGSITWTLGAALLEAGKAFSTRAVLHSYEIFQMKIKPVTLFAILFASIFSLICALSFVANWMPRFFSRPYLPLFRHSNASSTSVLNIPTPFRFQCLSSGDGRVKMPLSPTVTDAQQRPFGTGLGFSGSSIHLSDSAMYPSTGSVSFTVIHLVVWGSCNMTIVLCLPVFLTEVKCIFKAGDHSLEKTSILLWLKHTWRRFKASFRRNYGPDGSQVQ